MIVISSTLRLALVAAQSDNLPVLGWNNRVTIDNVAASSSQTSYPATNLANPSTTSLQGWRSDSLAEQYVTVTLSSDEETDYVAIARHNLGSAEVAVTVEGITAEEDAEWEVLVEEQFLGTDAPAIFRFEPAFLAGVRLKLTPDAVKPKAAVLYVGKLLVFEKGVQPGDTALSYARQRNVVNGWSQAGDFLGRIVVGGKLAAGVTVSKITPAWYRSTLQPFAEASAEVPFFWAWRPGQYPNEVGFAWLSSELRAAPATHSGLLDVRLEMEGIVS